MAILSQAPTRVDLAGGTLDIWPLYLFHENSQTINFAINCYARCRLTPRHDKAIELISCDLKRGEKFPSLEALKKANRFRLPLLARLVMAFATPGRYRPPGLYKDRRGRLSPPTPTGRLVPSEVEGNAWPTGGFTLETDSDSPAGAGLGGSSALNIAICGALAKFTGRKLPPSKLIEIARNVEAQVLRVPTGEQDYYAAVYGGAQAIRLGPSGVFAEKLPVEASDLSARFVLCYTGQSRNSGINNWEVLKAHVDGNRAVIRQFDRIARIAADMRQALAEHDWGAVARRLQQDWEARKRNSPGITTSAIERLEAIARRHGALAAKACGAGGGGCVVFLVEPEAKARVEEALRTAGARVMPFQVAAKGLQVREEASQT